MKNKTLTLILASVITLAMVLSFASAASTFTVSPTSKEVIILQPNSFGSFTITATNTSQLLDVAFSPSSSQVTGENGYIVTFGITGTTTGINGSRVFSATSSTIDYTNFKLGKDYTSGNIMISDQANAASNDSIKFKIQKSYCKSGDNTTSDIKITEIGDDSEGDSWTWEPLKDIKLTVNVENNAEKTKRVTVKIGLYDDTGKAIKLTEEDKELDETLSIEDGNDEDFVFEFKLPDSLKTDNSYRLYAKAFVGGYEDTQCVSYDEADNLYFKEISVDYPDYKIDEVNILDEVACGSTVTASFRLYNFGLGTQDKVLVSLYNKEIGDFYFDPVELEEGEDAEVTFNLNVSQYAAEKSYPLDVYVEYNYNDNTDVYMKKTKYEDQIYLNVIGNCLKQAVQNAELSIAEDQITDDVKAGERVSIKATVRNTATGGTGDEETLYRVTVEGLEEFATLKSISPSSLALKPGESKDVSIAFEVKQDAEAGDHLFNIISSFNGKKVTQQLSLSVGEFTAFDWIKAHWIISTLIAIAALIVLIVLVVVIRNRFY